MDLVLALSLEWNDTRLMWNENDFGDLPVKAIQNLKSEQLKEGYQYHLKLNKISDL